MIKISVIVPTYKPDFYIFECLDSLKNQTLKKSEYEIIIVLNGCNLPYYNNLINYISKDFQDIDIKLLQTDQPGVSNARNIGIENSKGEYICFIDDDDIVSPCYLESLYVKADEQTIVISNIYSFKSNINERLKNFFVCSQLEHKEQYINASLLKNRSFLAFPVAKIIHRHIIADRRFDKRFKNGEDALFITSLTDKIKHINFTDEEAIYYVRERIGSASRKKISIKELISKSIQLIIAYIHLYFKNFPHYNFPLFLSRIPGVIKNSIGLYKNNK